MKKRFSEEQIIGFLKQAEAGVPVRELCRQNGFSDASFYNWRAKYGGMTVPDAKRRNRSWERLSRCSSDPIYAQRRAWTLHWRRDCVGAAPAR